MAESQNALKGYTDEQKRQQIDNQIASWQQALYAHTLTAKVNGPDANDNPAVVEQAEKEIKTLETSIATLRKERDALS